MNFARRQAVLLLFVTLTSSLVADIQAARNNSGPVLYKTADAALFLDSQFYNTVANLTPGTETVFFADGGHVSIGWTSSSSSIMMAFVDNTDAALPALEASSVGLLQDNLLAQGWDPFQDLYSLDQTLAGAVSDAAKGRSPLRVLSTGYGASGALAQAAALWAAASYPAANIRLITFDAPAPGNGELEWATSRFVDLIYLWQLNGTSGATTNASSPLADVTYVLNQPPGSVAHTAGNATWEAYLQALNFTMHAATQPEFAASDATSRATSGGSTAPTSTGATTSMSDFLAGIRGDALQGRNAAPAPAPAPPPAVAFDFQKSNASCPLVLCKSRPATTAACNVYNGGSGSIAPGSVSINEPDSKTDLAVAWDAQTSTALIAFEGSIQKEDWLTDFMVWLNGDDLAPVVQQNFPEAKVHTGFLKAFQTVTSQATAPQYNITAVLNQLSRGAAPAHILVTGHSLGGGLATLGAVWAAFVWPEADVTCVTLGSPMTGNLDWAEAYKTYAGLQYRFVYVKDIVPSLPPLNAYSHVDDGVWADTPAQWLLENRPPFPLSDLNWDDHSLARSASRCYLERWVDASETGRFSGGNRADVLELEPVSLLKSPSVTISRKGTARVCA
ncbi:hypothetical protein WJX72_007656 [[Myrmecia] bisecta]|uniref:Fungal lipase-type domain-containing protein n=1 Tax=[Myrmecia] bisecta TaxID=41462 RepID=A0AAW1R855_9CHLO